MESDVRWFKAASGGPFQFQCGPRGIKVPRLADKVQLKDSTLELNGVVVDPDEDGYITLKEAAGYIGELGQSADNPIRVSGQPAAPPAAGQPTSKDLLAECLPPLEWVETGSTLSSSSGGNEYFLPPDGVAPLHERNQEWADDIRKLQQTADGVARWAYPLNLGKSPPTAVEAGVSHQMYWPLRQLFNLQDRIARPQGQPELVGWVCEASAHLVRDGAVDYLQSDPNAAAQLATFSSPPARNTSSNSSNRRTLKTRMDVVMLVKEEADSTNSSQQQQPPNQQHSEEQGSVFRMGRPIAVGEYKKPSFLRSLAPDGTWQPLNLLTGYADNDSKALHVIGQMYTYLLLLRLQFGFISCYHWTWVVNLPADRRVLYISDPIAHDAVSTADAPLVTAMGAMYWTQINGYKAYRQQVEGLPHDLRTVEQHKAATTPVLPASQPDQGPPDDAFDGPSYDPEKDPDGSPHRESKGRSSSRKASNATAPSSTKDVGTKKKKKKSIKQPRSSGATAGLQLGKVIYHGCSGPVLEGICKGQRAIIKVFAPDEEGQAAYKAEVEAYATLAPVQGSAVPKLLACGQLGVGVRYIATARVDGVPYSRLPSVHEAAAEAAVRAMQQIRSVWPCFLHGDIRLANIMLQKPGVDTAAPTAVILDFAASRLDASPREVAAESRQLSSLLR